MNFSGFLQLLKKAASLGIFRDDVKILRIIKKLKYI